jgi:small subunit ribosomal protein S9
MNATPTKKPAGRKPAAHKPHVARKPKAHTTLHKVEHKHEVKEVEQVATAPVAEPVVPKIPHGKHFYAVGRRKTAVAQVLMSAGNGDISVNKLPFEGYFQTEDLRQIVRHPMVSIGVDKNLNIKAKVHGGGIHAQAESMRHAISRALITYNPESRRTLKKLGFLTRDPRVKERKKPGLKRARRAPQFSKR